MREGCNVIRAENLREAIEKGATASVGAERVIDREQQAIDADHLNGAAEWWLSEVATGRDVDVGLEVGSDGLAKVWRRGRKDAIGAGERIRQAFAHMAND